MLVASLKKLYNIYYYTSPLPVLSRGEAIAYNAVALALAAFTVYWTLCILPVSLQTLISRTLYYLTGESISRPTTYIFLHSEEVVYVQRTISDYIWLAIGGVLTGGSNNEENKEINNSRVANWDFSLQGVAVHPK